MGALTTLADRSVAKLTEEEIIRRVVQSLADAAPAFPEGPGGDCAHLPTTGGRSIRASTLSLPTTRKIAVRPGPALVPVTASRATA